MVFDKIYDMKEFGFEGFLKIETLMLHDCRQIPERKGIYFVLNNDSSPKFLQKSVGGHYKGKDPTVSINMLKENWVNDAMVVYIGKAGGIGVKKATLNSRIKQFMQYGEGDDIGHEGGRLIWQLENNRELTLCYKLLPREEPRKEEEKLILEFEMNYDKMPFANLRH